MNSDDIHISRDYTDGKTTRTLCVVSGGISDGFTAHWKPLLDQATPPFKRWGSRQSCPLEDFAKWAVREVSPVAP